MDELFGGASAFADPYRSLDGFGNAERLHRLWLARRDNLSPGDEFVLVDEFAEILGIRGWYEWKETPDTDEDQAAQATEGVTNEDLLRRIAALTGGRYFNVNSARAIAEAQLGVVA